MSKTGAAFSVRFLRNGDQVTVVRDIIDKNGKGAALFQVVDPTSGVVSPDWTDEDSQPIIRLGVRSAVGYPTEITSVTWAYDGTTLDFAMNGSTWVQASNDARFYARINGSYYELRIAGNLASSTVVSNKQVSYEVSYVSNAMSDKVQGGADVLIQAAGSDSHILQVTADRVEIDAANPTATLTAVAQYGTSAVTIGSNGYTIKWYQDNVEISGQTSATLSVTRDMVSGGSIFAARLFRDGSAVAQDAQRVNDTADEYQIHHTPTDAGSNYVGPSHNGVFTLSLYKNNKEVTDAVSYAWQVYNALGEVTKSDGTGATVTITPDYCLCGTGQGAYHADCDVAVTADF